MSARVEKDPKTVDHLPDAPYEPLLPADQQLIGWSLAIGVALLVVLVLVSRTFFPAG